MRAIGAGLYLLIGGLSPLAGQATAATVEAALACFEESYRTGGTRCKQQLTVYVSSVLIQTAKYDASLVTAVLDGLEDLALHSAYPKVREMAAIKLVSRGKTFHPSTPLPGLVSRLERIYRQTTDWSVRISVVRGMAQQVQVGETVAFLEAVAQEDNPLDYGSDLPATIWALEALSRNGVRGQAALQRLHAQGTVPGIAKGYLEYLKQRDFQPD